MSGKKPRRPSRKAKAFAELAMPLTTLSPHDERPAAKPRRGPMAAAIAETASAVSERREAETAIRAENDALARAHAKAKHLGLLIELVPLEKIRAKKLIRDRSLAAEDPDLAELKASIREIGLSNPIRLERAGDGFELIQGWRRLSAYRQILADTKDRAFAVIPARITEPGDTMFALYKRMVDENLIRKDVSFAEMAMLARAYADDPDTPSSSLDQAVRDLYGSASYQKRSYIRAFADLMGRLDKALSFPQAIPRNLGVTLRARMDDAPGLATAIHAALMEAQPQSAVEELQILRRYAQADLDTLLEDAASAPPVKPAGPRPPQTRLTLPRPLGEARCTASDGRLEIRGPEDFSSYGPEALERALTAFYRALG